MSDETDTIAEEAGNRGSGGAGRIAKRVGLVVLAVVAVLIAVVATLYLFGSMETPSPEIRAEYERQVALGAQPPVEAAFHIPIPGCRCHSDDPVVQMEHSTRRIRDCGSCHGR